jgi:hypothetical protein
MRGRRKEKKSEVVEEGAVAFPVCRAGANERRKRQDELRGNIRFPD